MVQFSIRKKISDVENLHFFDNDGRDFRGKLQRRHSIQNSMLYRTVRKEKREIVKRHCRKRKEKVIGSVFYQEKDQ